VEIKVLVSSYFIFLQPNGGVKSPTEHTNSSKDKNRWQQKWTYGNQNLRWY